MGMVRILGVDPGSRLMGYGCVDLAGRQLVHVAHGTLKLSGTSGRQEITLEKRLLLIYEGLSQVIREFKPHVMVVERVFFAKNAVSALKLGQARGVALVTGAIFGLEVVDYSPAEVKAAVAGHGQADKDQVARMVQILIGKREFRTSDASDALAIAICHAQSLAMSNPRLGAQAVASARSSKRRKYSLAESAGFTAEPRQGKRIR